MTGRWTWHGGGLAAARAHFGGDDWLDLSTGINPHAWPGTEGIAVDWRRLPDEGELASLEAAAAAHFGCDPSQVCALPGTETGMRLIDDLLPGPAFHAVPGYRTHGAMLRDSVPTSGAKLGEVEPGTLILANPNNPDGRLLDRDTLLELLASRGRQGWLVVDEAFVDAHPGHSLEASTLSAPTLLADVRDDRRLLVFRSFGKFFGLAGVRLGFLIGPRSILSCVRERLGAWPVSSAAITIGRAAYLDASWIAAMRSRLAREAATLDAMLAARGFSAIGSCPLFRLIETPDAGALFEHLAHHAILTRPFDYAPNWLRIGLPADANALDRLEQALIGA